ncbi:MAG TPA: response regulator [Rudaea sp.]|nr:response regulator [Rudaea sp.]
MAGELILVVDDNASNLKVARIALESEGYEVRTAADGEQALGLLREIHPRLILMDVQLPLIDGLEVTRRIKADPATSDIIVIAVTAYAMKSDRETALAAGCDGYIAKPLDPIGLPAQIAQFLCEGDEAPTVATAAPAPELHAAPPPSGGPRILYVEDNAITRKLYRFVLQTAGYDVIEAEDGATALARFDETRPALILQDLVLPDIDGVELLHRFRARLAGAPLPILCVSGLLARFDELKVGVAGFAQVLLKPVDPALLIDVVHAHVSDRVETTIDTGARTVMVVEDDPTQQKLMKLWLRNAGLHVISANDGKAALALARREHPALVVSDILMPKLDGFALCHALRTDRELGSIPVVLLSSAYCEPADHALAARVGASALIAKIEGQDGLLSRIETLLSIPPPAPLAGEPLEREHLDRALWQLERQVQINARLGQRSVLAERLLESLARTANAVTREENAIGRALLDALGTSLDIAGVSKGALYLFDSNQCLALACQVGFREDEREAAAGLFGCAERITEAAHRAHPTFLPSAEWPTSDTQNLILASGMPSLLLVPITGVDVAHGVLLIGGRTSDVSSEEASAFARLLGGELGKTIGLARYAFRLANSERRYRVLTEHAYDAISLTTPDGTIREINPRVVEILGYAPERIVGRNIVELAASGGSSANVEAYRKVLSGGTGRSQPIELRKEDGSTVLMEFASAMVRIDGEQLMLSIGRDVTEQVRANERLQHSLTHDHGTGLQRLDVLEPRLSTMLSEAGSCGHRVAVLYLDLDYFHAINETRGYEVGDAVLRAIAGRLVTLAGNSHVARVAGDEFVVICRYEAADLDPADFAESVRRTVAQPIEIGDEPICATTCIGISCFPENSLSARELLRQAEVATIHAKGDGKDCIGAFSNDENEQLRDRLALGPQLRTAIRNDQLVLFYQPQIRALDGRVVGFEALVRWRHVERGLLSAKAFISAAEELGIIVELGRLVLEAACRQARIWLDAGAEMFTIAVNVSAQQLQRPDFVAEVANLLKQHGLPRDCIELELTEASMLGRADRVIERMLALRQAGVRLAIDDFGTGFSSLNYLRSLPVDCLKIDQSFVRDIVTDTGSAGICAAIVALGHQLGMRVLAEGVETAAQASYLKRHDCDLLQGFVFSQPVNAEKAFEILQRRTVEWRADEDDGATRHTLLLVDDESNILSALTRTLRRDGYRILTANSGEEALEILAGEEVHVILSDQRMPGMSGTELLSKAKELHPKTVRLVLSGYTDVSSVADAINRGAIYRFLMKPWNEEDLRLQIRGAFRAHSRIVAQGA